MEISLDLSILLILISLSGLVTCYFLQPKHVVVYQSVYSELYAAPLKWSGILQARTWLHHLLWVRRRVPIRSGRTDRGDEAIPLFM